MLIALAIVGLVMAVAVPALVGRVDAALAEADFAQTTAGARMLPARAATLGIDVVLDAEAARRNLPDGRPALPLPEGWTLEVAQPVRFGRAGSCSGGRVTVIEPAPASRRWTLAFAPVTGALTVTEGEALP